MDLPNTRLKTQRLTLLATYFGAFLCIAALVSGLLGYMTSSGTIEAASVATLAGVIFIMVMLGRLIVPHLFNDAIAADNVNRQLADLAGKVQAVSAQSEPEQQRAFIRYAPACIAMLDLNMNYIACSDKWLQENGNGHATLIGLNHFDVNPDMPEELRSLHENALRGIAVIDDEFLWYEPDGSHRWLRSSVQPWTHDNGEVGGLVIAREDITERKHAESDLNSVLEESGDAIWISNQNGNFIYANPITSQLTGYSFTELTQMKFADLIHEEREDELLHYLALTQYAKFTRRTWMLNHKNGSQVCVELTTGHLPGGRTIAIGEDITGRKKGEERIFELAYFDQLTGLPNRTLLLDRLNQVIALSSRSGAFGALLFIDLDHFKHINDTQGHQQGDLVLKQVADNLAGCLREGDTVARFGGDEFVVLLTGLGIDDDTAASNAKAAALKILDVLNQTYRLGDVVHHSTASIGVAMFNGKSSNTDDLLKQADLAMYKSKKAGRNTIRFFDPSLESAMKQQATLEEDLRLALQEEQFILHYQGQFTSESTMTGAEVLVRWKHPLKGMMSPALFIPFAEESGQILAIGNWVLETACLQLHSWKNNPAMSELMLAVNVSALQFRQPDFIETVLSIIERTGANPKRLKLELTESMLVENVEDIIQKMLALKLYGIGFSLDDFGTGYSSLSFLKRLPLDQLKIDQSFIRDVHSDPNGAAIAKTIVALGQSLGLNVIAEGVETYAQREFLSKAGCHAYQGYLFSRPLELTDFEVMADVLIKQ